jgi:hypothetical protein
VGEPRVITLCQRAFLSKRELTTEAIESLPQATGPTGREGRSEALEHRLEHMIMHKQSQVDFLLLTQRKPRL